MMYELAERIDCMTDYIAYCGWTVRLAKLVWQQLITIMSCG